MKISIATDSNEDATEVTIRFPLEFVYYIQEDIKARHELTPEREERLRKTLIVSGAVNVELIPQEETCQVKLIHRGADAAINAEAETQKFLIGLLTLHGELYSGEIQAELEEDGAILNLPDFNSEMQYGLFGSYLRKEATEEAVA